jgi:hypothetical protein
VCVRVCVCVCACVCVCVCVWRFICLGWLVGWVMNGDAMLFKNVYLFGDAMLFEILL